MREEESMILYFVLLILAPTDASVSSPVTCNTTNTACDDVNHNLIDIFSNIETLDQCRQICLDEPACNYVTYYDANSFPLREACLIFTECPSVHECDHCVSEDKDCATCGETKVGPLQDNLLDFMDYVDSEADCKINCIANQNCSYYTYFNEKDDQFPKFCFLLTNILEPTNACENCMTGPRRCRTSQVQAILSTGGWHEGSTEIFVPSSGFQCYLADMPHVRSGAVAVGNAVCGGHSDGWYDPHNVGTTCIRLESCSWNSCWDLQQSRSRSVLFESDSMALSHIMGGEDTDSECEQVQADCSDGTTASFDITDSSLVEACSITLPDHSQTYLTGGRNINGYHGYVEIYNNNGLGGPGPSMNYARGGHGCTSYKYYGKTYLMVAAGTNDGNFLDSVEIIEVGSSQEKWTLLNQRLYKILYYPKLVSVDGVPYLLGGSNSGYEDETGIYMFDRSTHHWTKVSDLLTRRSIFSTSLVNYDDVKHCCTTRNTTGNKTSIYNAQNQRFKIAKHSSLL